MRNREYAPRLPEIDQKARLSPQINPSSANSYSPSYGKYIGEDRTAGNEFRRLAQALGGYSSVLAEIGEGQRQDTERDLDALARHIAHKEENANKTFTQFTHDNPEYQGASPVFRRAFQSVRMERLSMEYDTALRTAYMQEGWVGIKDPEEFRLAVSAFTAKWREENLTPYIEKDSDLRLVDKHFTASQMKSEENLTSFYSTGRIQEITAEGHQEFKEYAFSAIEGLVKSPHFDFFSPQDLDKNLTILSSHLVTIRDRAIYSGVPFSQANRLIKEAVLDYVESASVEANDYRLDALLDVLEMIPTGTGLLGNTAENKLAINNMRDKLEKRRYTEEEQEYTRRTRENKQRKEDIENAAVRMVLENPSVTPFEVATALDIEPDKMVMDAVNAAKKAVEGAYDVPETAENRWKAVELESALRLGRLTIQQIQKAYEVGEITHSQFKHLAGLAPKDPAQVEHLKKLAESGGYKDSVKSLEDIWRGMELIGMVSPEGRIKSQVAKALFDRAVFADISRYIENGQEVDFKTAQEIVLRHFKTFSDLNNQQVLQGVEVAKGQSREFGILKELERMGNNEVYQPSEFSPIPHATPEITQYVAEHSQHFGVPQNVVLAFIEAESAFNPTARGKNSKGEESSAYGPMQLLKGTAEYLGVDPKDTGQNIYGGIKYIQEIASRHNLDLNTKGGIAHAYYYYHDGPNAKAPFSHDALRGAATVLRVYNALGEEQQKLSPVVADND